MFARSAWRPVWVDVSAAVSSVGQLVLGFKHSDNRKENRCSPCQHAQQLLLPASVVLLLLTETSFSLCTKDLVQIFDSR